PRRSRRAVHVGSPAPLPRRGPRPLRPRDGVDAVLTQFRESHDMKRFLACLVSVAGASTFTMCNAQFSAATPTVKSSVTTVTSTGSSGGFLVGSDDCNAPHRAVPAGSQVGVPFTT